jgi:hypothetical protein
MVVIVQPPKRVVPPPTTAWEDNLTQTFDRDSSGSELDADEVLATYQPTSTTAIGEPNARWAANVGTPTPASPPTPTLP